mmetsp:Transcript_9171/g.41588  ORF Transcript_9171/g.41588 Transcript_9171/m.41588 type:complete len:262 (+) Transcript_9171:421-1206(+)
MGPGSIAGPIASGPLEEDGVRTRDLAVAGPRSRDRNGGSPSSSSPAVGRILARASIAASTPPPRLSLGIRSSLSSSSSSYESYLPPLREPAFFVLLPFSARSRAGSLWSMPSPPGPVSNAGRSSTLDSDLKLLSPRPPAAVDGRRGSTPLLRGTSSKPPHRVLRIVAKAPPPLDAAGSSTSRRSRPSRVIRRPSPSYSGLSDAARAVDGRRRALAAVLGRLRSVACPELRSRRDPRGSSRSRRLDLGANASRALGSIRRPL